MSVSLSDIIPEVLPCILQWLPPRQLSCFTVNKYLYENASNDAIWKQLCLERKITPFEGRSFKQTYLDFSKKIYYLLSVFLTRKNIELPNSSIERREAIDQILVSDEEVLGAVLKNKNLSSELIKVFLVKFLEKKLYFPIKIFLCALTRKLPEETFTFIMDHCKSKLDSPSLMELMQRGRFNGRPLNIKLLSLFFHYKDLFLRIYLQSKCPLTDIFIQVMLVYLQEDGSLEVFHELLKRMKEEGLKFTATQCKNIFRIRTPSLPSELLKSLVAQCQEMPSFLIEQSLMSRCEMELKHLLDAGISVNDDQQVIVMGTPLTPESIDLLAPHINFNMMRLNLLIEFNNFKLFLNKFQELLKARDVILTDHEFFHLNLNIVNVNELYNQINQCNEELFAYKNITNKFYDAYLLFFEKIVFNEDNAYRNLYNALKRMGVKKAISQLAILYQRPSRSVLALLELSKEMTLSYIKLAARLEYSSETIKELICSIVEVDNNLEWNENNLIALRSLISLENYALLIKRCKIISEKVISKFMRDNDKEALQLLIESGIKMSQTILRNSLCDVDLFRMLLEAAEPQVSLSTLLKDAKSPYVLNNDIIRLLEVKIAESII